MKVRVRLFGTLRKRFTNYNHLQGFEVELPDGSRIDDLIDHLDIPTSKLGIVSVDGKIVNAHKMLKDEDSVSIFQPVFGG